MNLRDVAVVEFLASAPLRAESLTKLKMSSLWEDYINPREDGAHPAKVRGIAMKGAGAGKFMGSSNTLSSTRRQRRPSGSTSSLGESLLLRIRCLPPLRRVMRTYST